MRKKVLYLITKSNWGGAQRAVYDLAQSLPKNKFDVVVALGGTGPLKNKLDGIGIRTISISGLGRDIDATQDTFSFFAILRILRKERPDILHVHSPKAGGLGALAGRLLGISRIVFTAHGWSFKENRSWWQRKLMFFFSWLTVILAHTTIAVSNDDSNYAEGFLFSKGKIRRIYNGIATLTFLKRNEARKMLLPGFDPNDESRLWIGTISELHKNKGLSYAIEAIDLLIHESDDHRKIVFVVIGEGEERGTLESMIKARGLETTAFLVGHKHNAAALLKAFDIFTLTSLKEGLPYAVLEAGSAGLATVASGVGGIPEIVDDMHSGIIIKDKKASEIKEALKYLARNKTKRRLFGHALHRVIKERFNVKRMVSETLEIYK